jgi:DNA repair exonuclease SbcCD ATPase subunit
MALEQLNMKVEDITKQQLEETKEEFGSYGKMLEAFLYDYKMKKIKTGELKDIQEATLGAISGDFKSLEDLMRAISRVFVGMAEKLGYREAEAVNESTVLKTRVESLLQQHETELKAINAEKDALVQSLEKLTLEFNSVQKDVQLFEVKEKNLTDKLQEREEELQRRLDRIGELDEKLRAVEPIAKENEHLLAELQQKEIELSSVKRPSTPHRNVAAAA